MSERTTYEEDFYAWSREQAAILRELAQRRDLPNALDVEHVAEEIEDVGNAARHAVESFLRLIFVHLIKIASVETSNLQQHWRGEIVSFHIEFLTRFTKAMRKDLDLDLLWSRAIRQAKADLAEHNQDIRPALPRDCPLELDDFLGEDFDFEAALRRIEALQPRSCG